MSAQPTELVAGGLAVVGVAGPELLPAEASLLRRFDVAGVILFRRNVQDGAQLARLCAALQACRPADAPPLLVCADQEGGSVAPLAAAVGRPPSALAMGLAGDLALTRRVHAETARRAAACGVRWLLAPVADVVLGENPVVATRAFGADPQLVAAHVAAAIAGLRDGGVTTCAKHWPGHGRPHLDSHVAVPSLDVSPEEWERTELPPFRAAMQAGVDAVMVAHLLAPQLDASGAVSSCSAALLRHRLREQLGFSGVVVSDALEMAGFQRGRPEDALAAGIELLLYAAPIEQVAPQLEALTTVLRRGVIAPASLDAARARVLALRAAGASHAPQGEAPGTPHGGDDDAYRQVRERGVFVSPRGRAKPAPWVGSSAGGPAWVLVDAASADRLLRADPGDGLAPLPPPATSALEPGLVATLGAPRWVALVRSPADPTLTAEEFSGALGSIPPGAGVVLASLRPFQGGLGEAFEVQLRRMHPPWVAVLGDLSLAARAARALPGLPVVALPGSAAEDADVLGRWLTAGGASRGGARPG